MKKIIFALAIIFSFHVNAENADSLKVKKMAIGISFSPDYCYRYASATNEAGAQSLQQLNSFAGAKFGFTSGINALYRFNKKINLEVGVQYSDQGWQATVNNSSGVIPAGSPLISENGKLSLRYIAVPIQINYSFFKKRFKLFLSAGMATNFFIEAKSSTTNVFSNGTTQSSSFLENNDSYQKINFVALFGIGADYDLTKKINLRIEPIYRRFLNPFQPKSSDADGFNLYPYSLGLNTSVYYSF